MNFNLKTTARLTFTLGKRNLAKCNNNNNTYCQACPSELINLDFSPLEYLVLLTTML